MRSIYGPPNWNAYEDARASLEDCDQQLIIAHGKKLWALLGDQRHADAFWNVVAPLVHALAADGAEDAGYGEGFSAATAFEQLMHEVAIAHKRGELS